MICLPFSSCSTWVTSPLSLSLSFFPHEHFFFFFFLAWGENIWLSCSVLQKLMIGCLGAGHGKQCWAANRLTLSGVAYAHDNTWKTQQQSAAHAARTLTPLMDIPRVHKGTLSAGLIVIWRRRGSVLAPAMSLSPQRGASGMSAYRTILLNWYEAALARTWGGRQWLFMALFLLRAREKRSDAVRPLIPGFKLQLMETDRTYSGGTVARSLFNTQQK